MARLNKYGNTRTPYGGRVFASKREATQARDLDLQRRAQDPRQKVVAVQYQYKMPVKVNGVHICDYFADFYVSFADGHHEIQDAKGVKTDVYKLKKKLIEAIYGEKIIEI